MIKRVVIAGCRNYENYEEAKLYIDKCISSIKEQNKIIILSGGARGADKLGERYAIENGFEIECYPAEWKSYGKKAGPIRNKKIKPIRTLIFERKSRIVNGRMITVRYEFELAV